MHSKLYHDKNAYKIEIDIKNTRCPICKHKNLKMSMSGQINCKCGYINNTSHSYCGGVKINNNLSFKLKKIKPKGE